MTEKDGNEGASNRRIHDLQGLLHFCTEITAREDTTHASSVELTEERRQFLENVFHDMQEDAHFSMANCLKKLAENCVHNINEDVSEQEDALDELSDIVEDINFASDLEKMSGFPVLVNTLSSPHSSLQKRAAKVIGDVCQNNNPGQKNMLSLNIIEILLKILDTQNDPDCKVKTLYALSCITRDYEPAEKQFEELSGFCYLMRAIQTKIPKLVMKAVFLLNYFVEKTDKYKDDLLAMGFVEQLVSVLFSENVDDTSKEYCTLALLNFVSSYDKALQECLRLEFDLLSKLQERKKIITGKDEYQEEESYICVLLNLLEKHGESEESMIR